MSITIDEVTAATPDLVAAFARLLPQLSAGPPAFGAGELTEMLHAPGTTLLVAVDASVVVGSVTLVVFRIPSGKRARIESLVVDASARGRGVGRALCQAAIARARVHGADSVDLTSAPTRVAANALYLQLGFTRRTTNVYRHPLVPSGE